MSLTNINPVADTNIGGLDVCFFTELDNILSWPEADNLILKGDLVVKPGTEWYMMGYTRSTARFEQAMKSDRHGDVYPMQFRGFIPTDSPQLGNTLYNMKQRRFAKLFRDRNGYLRITPPGVYTEFNYRYDSGDNPSDRPGYKVEFEGESVLPAFYYSGSFEASEIGIVQPPTGGSSEPVTIYFNGQVVKVLQPGEKLDVTSPYTMAFDIRFV